MNFCCSFQLNATVTINISSITMNVYFFFNYFRVSISNKCENCNNYINSGENTDEQKPD